MAGGQNRLPDATKRLRGTLRKHRVKPGVARPPPSLVPPPPRRLSAAERRVWLELAPQLDALGAFAASDVTALRLLCRTIALVDAAGPETAPSALARMVSVASGLLGRFGLDPASRSRVTATRAPVDKTEDFLFGGPRLVTTGGVG